MSDLSLQYLGNFQLDQDQQALLVNNRYVYLRKQLWDLIMEFKLAPGKLISRDYLIERLWRNNYAMGEPGLNQAIYSIRTLLKQDAEGSVSIQTIAKRGYRLVTKTSHYNRAA